MFAEKVSLSDGTEVTIRPAQPRDVVSILELHQRLSPQTIYYRYLRSYTPTYAEIERICQIPDNEGAAFVAAIDIPWETVIGLGYYLIDRHSRHSVAEPALLIEDRFQGQGLGRILLQRLSEQALAQKIPAFNIHIHPANWSMRRLVERSGFAFEEKLAYGTREMRLWLNPAPARTGPDRQPAAPVVSASGSVGGAAPTTAP